jgi:hypothetical protein
MHLLFFFFIRYACDMFPSLARFFLGGLFPQLVSIVPAVVGSGGGGRGAGGASGSSVAAAAAAAQSLSPLPCLFYDAFKKSQAGFLPRVRASAFF